jgi:predicted MPP superfamily phosphohydrolase
MHAYAFVRARGALGFSWGAGVPLALFMLFMVLAPIVVRITEREGFEIAARALSHVCYLWLGVLFLFFCAALAMDLFRLVVWLGGLAAKKNVASLLPSPKAVFFVPLAFALLASAYGYFEALDIRTEKVTIRTSKLPPDVERLRIAQISDVHLGLIVREKRLKKILDTVRPLEPDIFVCTGDFVDGQINRMPGLAAMLKEFSPRYGKYAITGNHEFYAGLNDSLKFIEDAGFRMLRGEAVSGVINIAGVDDPTGMNFQSERYVSEEGLLKDLPRARFTLLLKHRPHVNGGSRGLFDLQLSGHTHKGQLFPFYYVVRLLYPATGRHDLENGSTMYLSRGTGTWGPPVRFLAPPEVTLIELVRE